MGQTKAASVDSRVTRGDITRKALMRAAEKLIARRGIENITIKDILAEARQNNASALQYHFTNLQGLVRSLRKTRGKEISRKREALFYDLLEQNPDPSLRDICALMVAAPFELARAHPDFRNFIKAFGHEIVLAEGPAGKAAVDTDSVVSRQLVNLLQARLTHLDDLTFVFRVDGALRFTAASLVHHAQQPKAFKGHEGDLFFNSLVDALAGLLSAPVSEETQALRHDDPIITFG